jgi:hypothetical protein
MENFRFVIDPTRHFEERGATKQSLVEATGFLPAFALGDKETIAENLESNYRFFNEWRIGDEEVDEQGIFYYPDDPPLHPILLIAQGEEKIYIYQYGIVTKVNAGKYAGQTRMD